LLWTAAAERRDVRATTTSVDQPINPSFRVGDVLAGDLEGAAIARFMVAARQLVALRFAIRSLKDHPGPASEEARHFLFMLMFGAAKEAADAFRDCDSQSFFGWLDQPGEEHLAQIRGELARARQLTDKRSETSLYSRFLKPLRDRAAFHLPRTTVESALDGLRDETVETFILDSHTNVLGVPLAQAVLARASWGESSEEVAAAADGLGELMNTLVALSHDYFRALVLVRGLPDAPAP
jgi:hypothetical protein